MANGKVTQTPGAFLEFTDQNGTPLVSLNRDGGVACASMTPIFPPLNGISTVNLIAPGTSSFTLDASTGTGLTIQASQGGTNVGGYISLAPNVGVRPTTFAALDGQNDVIQMGNISNSPNIDGISLQCASGRQIQIADNSFNGFAYIQANGAGSFQAIGTATTIQAPKLIETATLSPTSGATAGTTGQIAWDTGFIYICTNGGTAGNATWKKAALSAA